MGKEIYQIYDKVFKKILTLSATAVINLVNGLFDTNYPLDSTIQYNWTEFKDKELRSVLADTIITINGVYSYHMEAQMTKDEDIIFRVFEYGYGHANHNSIKEKDGGVLRFPEPKIIYLYSRGSVPDEYVLKLEFGKQGSFLYRVPTFKFMETSTKELNERKMVILIPFALLKLREAMKKERSPENFTALKKLIENDIIGSINENLRVGNLTVDDARRLKRLTHKLYEHIYSHYEELEELTEMTDESLMLDIDIIEKEHQRELAQKDEKYAQKLAERDEKLAQKEAEIAFLKKKLAEMGGSL